ncbi:uncharacterized protein LOC130216597 [Danio aesculapii]|uniref:uncharacterized protein LOC130216597 n=1 Tax=Danio aesculapii TaxID=1142201 RepID=UPI0024BFED7D|nr:uncharacterized protein LOC130216597 [Danio aesculapii]
MKIYVLLALCVFCLCGVSGVSVLAREGESVTLPVEHTKSQDDRIKWYFNDERIAEIFGNQSKICADVKCKETFTDRLKLDNETGFLTITNSRTTDSGVYKLLIMIQNTEETFNVTICAEIDRIEEKESVPVKNEKCEFEPDENKVFGMEGDLVILHNNGGINQQDRIKWYFDGVCIAEFFNDQHKNCTDEGNPERFGNRLNVNRRTGDLSITNTRPTDTGVYKMISRNCFKTFHVTVSEDFSTAVIKKAAMIGGAVSAAVVLVVVIKVLIFSCKKRKAKAGHNGNGTPDRDNQNSELKPLKPQRRMLII